VGIVLFVLLLMVAALVALGLAARASLSLPAPRTPVEVPAMAREAATSTARWRWAGIVLGAMVAPVTLHLGALGRGLLLAAPAFALCVLAGVVVGELRLSAPRGTVRRADLMVRRWQDYVPRPLFGVVMSATAVLALVLAYTSGVGASDDLGRAGRWLVRRCSATMTQGHGPWPGSFYAVPLAVLVGAGLLLAGVALLRIARRPSQGEDAGVEDALRQRAAAAVTAAAGLLVAVPLGGVSAVAAIALLGIECRPGWWSAIGWGLVLLIPAAVGLAVRCLVVLTSPTAQWAPAGMPADR
jgi:hypothetical protein